MIVLLDHNERRQARTVTGRVSEDSSSNEDSEGPSEESDFIAFFQEILLQKEAEQGYG